MSVQGTDGSQLAPEEESVAKAVSGTASGRLQGVTCHPGQGQLWVSWGQMALPVGLYPGTTL